MSEVLHPGVYVNEVQSGNAPIEGAGTSVAGFIGYTKRGPVGKPVLVTSWTDFSQKFSFGLDSPFLANANLAYSVFGFFQNGGTNAYIVRAASSSVAKAKVVFTDGDTSPVNVLEVEAVDEGVFGNDLAVRLAAEGDEYLFTVKQNGTIVDSYVVSLNPEAENFIEYVVNGVDKFVKVSFLGGSFATNELGVDRNLTGGSDGISNATDADLVRALDSLDTVTVNLIAVPESQSTVVNQAGFAYAEKKLAFFVADGLMDADVDSILAERDKYNSEYGALYYPWIRVSNPIAKGADKTRYVPTAGHVAGVIARIDGLRGVFKAPAGLDAGVRGAIDVKVAITDQDQNRLNPKGVNAIRSFSGAGIVVWGARTVSSNPAVRYINVRRSLLFLRQSLQLGTKWAIFEPNNHVLWNKLTTSARGFLLGQFRQGMFQGASPEQSFFVKCDSELNPQSEIDLGRVNMQIGVAINKPGEFVIINIGQWDGGNN